MSGFASLVVAWAGRTTERIDGARRRLADDLLERVAAATPVKTGRARDGWRLAESEGVARVVNDVPYAAELEQDAGMVRGALAAWPDIVAEAVGEQRS